MSALETIQKSAQSIVTICEKDRLTKADKDSLLKLQGEIFTQIDSLTGCEVCGGISDLIVSITIDTATADLCRECGIQALNAGEIRKSGQRRRSSRKSQSPKRSTKTTIQEPKTTVSSPVDLRAQIGTETGLNKATVRRIEKIIEEIATPMNVENTIQYVVSEAKIAKIKIEDGQLEQAVKLFMGTNSNG